MPRRPLKALSRGALSLPTWLMVTLTVWITSPGTTSDGGTIRHDRDDQEYLDLAADPAFSSVGKITLQVAGLGSIQGSGVLIRDNWLLTAAHVIDGTNFLGAGISNLQVRVAGSTMQAAEWIVHPQWEATRIPNISGDLVPDLFAGWDIGLVRLPSAVAGIAPARLPDSANVSELGAIATIVGFGTTGTGETGFDPQLPIVKRAGINVVDVVGAQQTAGSNPSFRFGHSRMLAVDFDNPTDPGDSTLGSATPLDLEYLTAPGDSGGGLFIDVDGITKLAGITSIGTALPEPVIDSDYGDRASYTRVSQFINWINNTILPGDFNGDGLVNTSDYAVWRAQNGRTGMGYAADGNLDGVVDQSDYEYWRARFGNASLDLGGATSSLPLPEPSAEHLLTLVTFGSITFVRGRSRSQFSL